MISSKWPTNSGSGMFSKPTVARRSWHNAQGNLSHDPHCAQAHDDAAERFFLFGQLNKFAAPIDQLDRGDGSSEIAGSAAVRGG